MDDRLPTVSGRLIYGQNLSQPDEFWVPLVEKAYAKYIALSSFSSSSCLSIYRNVVGFTKKTHFYVHL